MGVISYPFRTHLHTQQKANETLYPYNQSVNDHLKHLFSSDRVGWARRHRLAKTRETPAARPSYRLKDHLIWYLSLLITMS
jgi:hypothetical protein